MFLRIEKQGLSSGVSKKIVHLCDTPKIPCLSVISTDYSREQMYSKGGSDP